jgi:hypothetical protein
LARLAGVVEDRRKEVKAQGIAEEEGADSLWRHLHLSAQGGECGCRISGIAVV